MLTKESIYVILFSLPVYQLLFYTVQLISFKRKNPSKKYLGLLLLLMTTFLLINAIHFLGYQNTFSDLYIIYLPVLLSIAPAYFLYILSITKENHDVKNRQKLILFLPSIVLLIANIFILGSLNQETRLSFINDGIFKQSSDGAGISGHLIVLWSGGLLLVFGQIIFAILKVSKIMQTETDIMHKEPAYLAYLEWRWILGISFSVLLFLVINALIETLVPINYLGLTLIYNLLMLLAGGVTGYLGMKQDDLLNQVEKISFVPDTPGKEFSQERIMAAGEETLASFISITEAKEIHKMIIDYLESEKPFIQSEYSMHDLCNQLNISRRKISYVLNEIMDKNFYGVINEYRIKEAETLLLKDDITQLKIEVLGEMVGFQSKSSFNACFKKFTGMTPSEYKIKKRLS